MQRLNPSRPTRLAGWLLAAVAATAAADDRLTVAAGQPDGETAAFDAAASVIVRRCLECHQSGEPSGGLDLSRGEGLHQGGDSGPAVDPDDVTASLLLSRVRGGEMPPEERGVSRRLPAEEIAVLEQWLAQGAPWPENRVLDLYEASSDVRGGRDWWSLQPVERPDVFGPGAPDTVAHPVDVFVRRRLDEAGLDPAPEADRRTLIRRLYNDLVGLPPTAAQIEAFVADDAPLAWERLVDSLLASPHFGERWARYWLDLVRYAETSGYERDQPKPFAWKYRDWVQRAFNADLPYDRFIVMQLAGDELPDRTADDVIATGFLRLGTWNDEPNDPADYQYERLEDLVHATSSAFLGMSVKCARCHDHKFDPIPQVDYYRMASAFWAGPIGPRSRDLLGGPSAEELGMPDVLGWTDVAREPAPLHLLKNGERHHPMQEVAPASLTLWPDGFSEFDPPREDAATSQRRLQLARWIARPDNPLTARVIVNRLWQHHFGEGLVRSSNNFGFTGDLPTHPELLDWLAAELIENAWSLKHIHRLLVTSTTYRQASVHPEHAACDELDSANRLWWRANRRRIDAETLRDSVLAASGALDLQIGGESFRPHISPEALEGLSRKDAAYEASPPADQRRRSLYTYMQRSLLPPLMTTFDLCDTTLPCDRRDVTIVAPQALALLNNEFVHEQSRLLAERAVASGPDEAARLATIWRSILAREPLPDEAHAALHHVRRQLARLETTTAPALTQTTASTDPDIAFQPPEEGLTLWLDAGAGIEPDEHGAVTRWSSPHADGLTASQPDPQRRPQWVKASDSGPAVVRWSGDNQFLFINGELLTAPECTILAVVADRGKPGHREIISNWNGREGNSVSSLFLGLTDADTVRFSDVWPAAGRVTERDRLFVLTAVNAPAGAAVFQNRRKIADRSTPLEGRRLDTPWVIGQQGNIDGEYWQGDMAAVLVYDRPLDEKTRDRLIGQLMSRFNIPSDEPPQPAPSAEVLAWASLCVVLFNSNEFLYVD